VKQQVCGVPSCAAPLTKGAIFHGLRLCASCFNQVAAHLIGLPRMYRDCEQTLEVSCQHPFRMIRGRLPTGIRLDDETVAVRSEIVGVLSSWCEMVVDDRGGRGPTSLDVRMLASFLHAQLDWLATHAVAADFAEEIAGLVLAVLKVQNPSQVRTIDLAPCTRDGCGAMVRVSIDTVRRRTVPQVCCDAGHTWHPRQWLDLSRQLDLANCDTST
jgi:hypothetical protein